MNYNYVGSVAERLMKFRSSLASTEEINENLFNKDIPKEEAFHYI